MATENIKSINSTELLNQFKDTVELIWSNRYSKEPISKFSIYEQEVEVLRRMQLGENEIALVEPVCANIGCNQEVFNVGEYCDAGCEYQHNDYKKNRKWELKKFQENIVKVLQYLCGGDHRCIAVAINTYIKHSSCDVEGHPVVKQFDEMFGLEGGKKFIGERMANNSVFRKEVLGIRLTMLILFQEICIDEDLFLDWRYI